METFADAFPIPPSTPWQDWTTISPADLSVVTKYNADLSSGENAQYS